MLPAMLAGLIASLERLRRKLIFERAARRGLKASAPEQTGVPALPDIVLDEGMNTPPRIVAIDPPTGRKSLLMDLNPQFQNLALARVEEITWKDSRGNEVKGGLYWPPDYVAGKKYPVVIQTHGWNPDRFWMDGPWTTAFAAQALAGKGFFVVQVPDPDWHISVTSKEAPRAMAAYEGAIDYLDRRGLIDPKSSRDHGVQPDVLVRYVYVDTFQTPLRGGCPRRWGGLQLFPIYGLLDRCRLAGEFEQVYGGPPYGKRLSQWLKQSPAFLMDRIETPLRIQTLGPESLLLDWHWYSGLSRLGKPVEMIYIPEGTHILEKPWDRMISQQGNVDWFCFWLKGEEDPDPAKAEQYTRWRELRKLQETNKRSPTANPRRQ